MYTKYKLRLSWNRESVWISCWEKNRGFKPDYCCDIEKTQVVYFITSCKKVY